jgi:hypothetical protein
MLSETVPGLAPLRSSATGRLAQEKPTLVGQAEKLSAAAWAGESASNSGERVARTESGTLRILFRQYRQPAGCA